MTDKKYTDEEIIKALECCCTSTGACENNCPMCDLENCNDVLMADYVFDLINRQKAENERLNIELKAMRGAANSYKAENERLKVENIFATAERNAFDTSFNKVLKQLKTAKTEAYQEFAKFLIDKSSKGLLRTGDLPDYVKEMVGEE